MKRILITGGAGFIGYELSQKFINEGYEVTILDNLSSKVHSDKSKYNTLKNISNFIIGDVCSRKDWELALTNQDAIIHLASETGTGQSMYDIYNYTNVNVGSTALMLDILSSTKNKVKKILLSSSRSVYGEGKYINENKEVFFPKKREGIDLDNSFFGFKCPVSFNELNPVPTDEDSDLTPASIYSLTKYNQERMLQLVCNNLNISPIILRYQNVYGPGQSLSNPYTGILSIFSTRILNNNDIEVYEDGLQTRDLIYIDNVVNITFAALITDNLRFNIYNVGSGKAHSVISVAKKLKEFFKSNININISKRYRVGDIRHNFADISRLKSDFDCANFISFDEGLKSFVNWVKTQNIEKDLYDNSVEELEKKGLIR